MDRVEILSKVEEIFQDVLDLDELKVQETDTPEQIEDWDSIANVNIIIAIESEFGMKLDIDQIASIKKVGDFVDAIEKK